MRNINLSCTYLTWKIFASRSFQPLNNKRIWSWNGQTKLILWFVCSPLISNFHAILLVATVKKKHNCHQTAMVSNLKKKGKFIYRSPFSGGPRYFRKLVNLDTVAALDINILFFKISDTSQNKFFLQETARQFCNPS